MIRSLEHVGISVSSLERSLGFYRDLLGMEVIDNGEFSGDLYERILGLEGARGKVALLRSGGLQIELFEFAHPVSVVRPSWRPVAELGISHFCIEVHDLDGLYRRLSAAGTVFHSTPLEFSGVGKATYGRDPDGNVFELFERASPTGPRAIPEST